MNEAIYKGVCAINVLELLKKIDFREAFVLQMQLMVNADEKMIESLTQSAEFNLLAKRGRKSKALTQSIQGMREGFANVDC